MASYGLLGRFYGEPYNEIRELSWYQLCRYRGLVGYVDDKAGIMTTLGLRFIDLQTRDLL